ncbi:MAG: AI-2E family transporter [Gillisia sp.]
MLIAKIKRTNTVLFFIFLIIVGLYYGSTFLIPFTFAVFFSTLVVPFSNFLEKKAGFGRILSSFVSTLILFLGIGILMFLLFRQLEVFVRDIVERRVEIMEFLVVLQEELVILTGFTTNQQVALIEDSLGGILNFFQGLLRRLITNLSGIIGKFLLILIYVFLLLINRNKFEDFIIRYVSDDRKVKVYKILEATQQVAHKYLWGRIQVMFILGIMYSITFFAYGLEHALLLIIFGVIITVIPYIGPFISGVLPVLFMIIFGGSTLEIVSFTFIVLVIQLIESYVAEPIIIGSEVQQSPLFVIIAIILGGIIWGLPGMILFVPIFAILKIIFDNSKQLKPVGYLIGYERPDEKAGFFDKMKKKLKK